RKSVSGDAKTTRKDRKHIDQRDEKICGSAQLLPCRKKSDKNSKIRVARATLGLKPYCQNPECIGTHFSSIYGLAFSEWSRYLPGEGRNLSLHHSMSRPFRPLGVEIPAASSGPLLLPI